MWTDSHGASPDALCDHAVAAVREIECFGKEPALERGLRRWRLILEERALVVARLSETLPSQQRAEIHTGTVAGGVLSPVWEDSLRSFQELVIRRLQ